MHLCCARKRKNLQIGYKKVEYKTERHTTRDDIDKFSGEKQVGQVLLGLGTVRERTWRGGRQYSIKCVLQAFI